jgi:hypothetical protein
VSAKRNSGTAGGPYPAERRFAAVLEWLFDVPLVVAGSANGVAMCALALDRPFRSDLGIGPEPYQLVYDPLMSGPG